MLIDYIKSMFLFYQTLSPLISKSGKCLWNYIAINYVVAGSSPVSPTTSLNDLSGTVAQLAEHDVSQTFVNGLFYKERKPL